MRFPGDNYPIHPRFIDVTDRSSAVSAFNRVFHNDEIARAALLLVLFHQERKGRQLWEPFTVSELIPFAIQQGMQWDECRAGLAALCTRLLVFGDAENLCRLTHDFIAKVFEASPRSNVVNVEAAPS